jgi:hypothetical protein
VRVRLIRPAYWTDTDLHTRLTADQREFYVGLWMLADDDGYVSWDVDRVGAELYPYRPLRWFGRTSRRGWSSSGRSTPACWSVAATSSSRTSRSTSRRRVLHRKSSASTWPHVVPPCAKWYQHGKGRGRKVMGWT